MKKIIYLLITLLSFTPSIAIKKLANRVVVASALFLGVKHHKKQSLTLHDLDEKEVLGLILNNYIRGTKIKTNVPNELRRLIHLFFIHEWTIHGLHKNTGTAYDPHGFDIRGLHKKTKNHLDPRGFKKNGNYKNLNPTTGKPTKYNPQGYDIDGWNKHGFYENGRRVDHNGFAQHVNHASISLHKAIKNENVKAVTLLLKQPNININLKGQYGYTPLIWGCKQGDKSLKIAESLLVRKDIKVNLGDEYRRTPLIWCCWTGDKSLDIAKRLIDHKDINVNLGDQYDYTPLRWCCIFGNQSLDIAKALLGHKDININSKDQYGYTPLIWCCRKGDKSLQIAKALLGHKDININLSDVDDNTPLDWIIYCVLGNDKYYQYVNLWSLLVKKGAVLNQCKKYYTILNPNDFREPHRTYVALIKQTPPINCKNIKRIAHQQCENK